MDLNVEQFFDSIDSAWDSSTETREELPDGKYRVQLVSIEEKQTKAGDPYFAIQVKVMDKPFAGRHLFPHQYLKQDPRRISIIKRNLEIIGVKGKKLAEIRKEIRSLNGTEFWLTKKTKDKWINFFFDSKDWGASKKEDTVPF